MATLQDLLANSNPQQLQEILAAIKNSNPQQTQAPEPPSKLQALMESLKAAPSQQSPIAPPPSAPMPSTGPTPLQAPAEQPSIPPSPVSQQMLGMPPSPNVTTGPAPSAPPASSPSSTEDNDDNDDNSSDNDKDGTPSPDNKSDSDNKDDDKEDDDKEDDDNSKVDTSAVDGHYIKNYGDQPTAQQKANLAKALGQHLQPISSEDQTDAKDPDSTSINTVGRLKAAQDAANEQTNRANLMKGLGTLNSGLIGLGSKSRGATPNVDANNKFYDEYAKQGEEKVQQFKDLAAQEKNDPNSQGSIQAATLAGSMLGKAGFDPSLVKGMSYSDIEKNFPQITKMMDNKQMVDYRKELMQQHSQDNALKLQAMGANKSAQADLKAGQVQDKSLQTTQQLLESARGNPAAAQAEKDLYAAQKADSLFNRYKDPNNMNSAEVQLYATEIAKMAAGGVPSIHELQGLNPSTIPGELAKVAQKVTNEPTSANAGEFLKRYKAYSDSLANDAKKVITDKYSRVIEPRKSQLGDDNYQALQDKYINRFKDVGNAAPVAKQDPKISKYASDNNLDYDHASAILKQRGYTSQE